MNYGSHGTAQVQPRKINHGVHGGTEKRSLNGKSVGSEFSAEQRCVYFSQIFMFGPLVMEF